MTRHQLAAAHAGADAVVINGRETRALAHTNRFLADVTAKLGMKFDRVDGLDTEDQPVPVATQRQPRAKGTPKRPKSFEEISHERREARERRQKYAPPIKRKGPSPLFKGTAVVPTVTVTIQARPVAPLEERLDLKQFVPKRGRGAGGEGAGALAELLESAALAYLATRPELYDDKGNPPAQVIIHNSAELAAAALGVSDTCIRGWTEQLERAGHIVTRPHYTTMTGRNGERMTVIDGTLYAVSLQAGHRPRIRYEDLKRRYRDLDADRKEGHTAYAAIQQAKSNAEKNTVLDEEKNSSGSTGPISEQEELRRQFKRWAVLPGGIYKQTPLSDFDPELFAQQELNTVPDVAEQLPLVLLAHPARRADLVGLLGHTLSRILKDNHSAAYWCKLIWQAYNEDLEGRNGLTRLGDRLRRLAADLVEYQGINNPAAWFAARERDQKAA